METKVIKAFPPGNLSVESSIEEGGNLLLHENILIIFSTERIYGYNVSIPEAPEKKWELKGELKIPGYSSYLHPLTRDKILGIGKESSQVKISIFDVSAPESPVELDKYMLNEYWSDILTTHHAFLLDEKHEYLIGGLRNITNF